MAQAVRTVAVDVEDGIAQVWLNRPDRLNAASARVLTDLLHAFEEAQRAEVRAMIIAGRGTSFCAGHDLQEVWPPEPVARRAILDSSADVSRAVRLSPFPVIAAVHGYAIGAGCEIALMCDLIVADRNAQFAFPEVSIAQAVSQGISHRLPRVVGPAIAKELVLFGRRFPSSRALELGLINEVTPAGEHLTRARHWAEAAAELPPHAVRLAKEALDRGPDSGLEEALTLEIEHLLRIQQHPASARAAAEFRQRHDDCSGRA